MLGGPESDAIDLWCVTRLRGITLVGGRNAVNETIVFPMTLNDASLLLLSHTTVAELLLIKWDDHVR